MIKTAVLFSGWNQRGVIAFCRFCKSRRISFAIVAKNDNDPILLSPYQENVIQIRKEPVLTMVFMKKLLVALKKKNAGFPVLMPSTEYLNRFYLTNKTELEAIGYEIPLCEEALYDTISDKSSFERLCIENGIKTPQEYTSVTEDNIPFVIKPRAYFFGDKTNVAEKPKLIMSIDDYYRLGSVDKKGYYCQEFVGGNSYYLLYYFSKNGSYSIYSPKNFMQQHSGLSIVAAESSMIHEDERAKAYTEMFISIGFHGLVMVEIRDYKGELYMIEANPRFWGPSQLILDAGMDLFEGFANDCGLLSEYKDTEYKSKVKYFWLGGIYETTSLKEKCIFHSRYSAEYLLEEMYKWIDADVYNRSDTFSIFGEEIKK